MRATFATALLVLLALAILLAAEPAAGDRVGVPLTGEAILKRDVDVRSTPAADGRIVMRLPRGKTVTALGTPRHTPWTRIARAGRPLGYVPWDSLESIYAAREIAGQAAAVARRRYAPAGTPTVTHVVAERAPATAYRDGRKHSLVLEPGTVLTLLALENGKARLAAPDYEAVVVDRKVLLPVVGVHDLDPAPSGLARSFYINKVGAYRSEDAARAAWRQIRQVLGPRVKYSHVYIYPDLDAGDTPYTLAFGPWTRHEANALCVTLAQRELDCWILKVHVF